MYNPDKYKSARIKPLQPRGKEKVRVILAAAMALFKERGFEDVTTNDIAARAHIPIGSLYRYYPNKDTIIVALTELCVDDLCEVFDNISQHPFLPYLSWDEVLLLMVDSWVNYAKLNGSFALLYAENAQPRLRELNIKAINKFSGKFAEVLRRRCPQVSDREFYICFHLSLAAAELGISDRDQKISGPHPHYEAVGAIARYMLEACNRHGHGM
ncbi:MAG TPA: TetR/AcrR family transcriptional regulator [Patescibacteria group bacterium]|nr:TetR/AcrR family transcriptional regulator [Patescibacteria group bacterium]